MVIKASDVSKQAQGVYWFIGLFLGGCTLIILFALTTTYHLSIQAKYYYVVEDYERAYALASEAYAKEPYNLMAFTIRQQSGAILQLYKVTSEAKAIYDRIRSMTKTGTVSKADLVRIKLLCQIAIDDLDSLHFPLLDRAELYDRARQYRDEFAKILNSIERTQHSKTTKGKPK